MSRSISSNFARRVAILLSGGALATGLALPGDLSGVSLAQAEPVRVEAPQAPNFADVVDAVSPAVVSVKVERELPREERRGFRFDRRLFEEERDEGFLRSHPFFRDREKGREKERDGHRGPRFGMNQGSGFFVSGDGYVVTNHHVVANGSKFKVVLGEGAEYDATLVGADARTDLAVLKVQADREFTYVKFAEGPVRVGEWVVAVGNPFGLGGTVTAGIVSAHGRALNANRYDDFIQIDAAVNRGNSGGPAFNLNGEVIGVNNAILSPNGGNVGIAFAIPAASASEIVQDLIENGRVVRGWLGVQIQPVTADIAASVGLAAPEGVIVTSPQNGSPAEKAGVKPGDILTAVNGRKIENPRQLARLVAGLEPGSEANLALWRDGATSELKVTLGTLREDPDSPRRPMMDRPGMARLGLELVASGEGVTVVDVVPGSPADEKGLRAGDVIVSVSGKEVRDPGQVADAIRDAAGSDRPSVLLQVRRGDSVQFIAVPVDRG